MRFRFLKRRLRALYEKETGASSFAEGVVEAFFDVMAIIAAAKDERDLYGLKSLRFEKLKGSRSHERSLRLTKQWRLVVEIESGPDGNRVVVKDIEDYH